MNTSNNILITGASGLIGTRLTELLLQQKANVSHLGRHRKNPEIQSYTWDVNRSQIDNEALKNVDTIVHLAGAGVAEKRWTKGRKREILESRIRSGRLLFETLKKDNTRSVKTLVSASGVAYYGFGSGTQVFKEHDGAGTDFLSTVTQQWEKEADRFTELGIRVVKLRIGFVLSERGGALKEMAAPVHYFVGAPLGSGEQLINWIHIDDLCQLFIKAIDDSSMSGPYNAVGPYPVTNRELTKAIAKALHKPLILPFVPAFVLKLMLGELAEIVLKGSHVSSGKIVKEGFSFQFNTLENALEDLLSADPKKN
jgi:uncharacterized protein (TIGR01777 family)